MSETQSGREPIILVQLDQDFCVHTYGESPCTADQETRCYNTRKTCQDPQNYSRGTLTLTFAKPNTKLPKDLNLLPFIESTSTAPTKINPTNGNLNNSALGERGVLTVQFQDAPHTDFLVDKYLSTRNFDPLERSTFWAKWLARNYYQNRLVRLYEGYAGQNIGDMNVRHYLIDSITDPDSSGRVRLVAKDPLKLSEKERAQVPAASTGQLNAIIDSTQTSLTVKRALIGDYDQPGTIRINDEIITYSTITESAGILTFETCVRAQYGTTASSHGENDTVQKCIVYVDKPIWETVRDFLIDFAAVDPIYIDDQEWEDEYNAYLAQFNVSVVLNEPQPVFDALNQLSQQMPFYIWWDDRNNKIQFKAVRYFVGDFPILTEDNILENSFSATTDPRNRISQVWVYHTPRDWTKSERSNFKGVEINANLELESRDFFDEQKIRIIEGRWITQAQAFNLTSRLIRANYNNPIYVKLRVDAKDRALWTGDIVDVKHRSLVDFSGEPIPLRYQVISSQEIVSGEVIEYQLVRLITLTVKAGYYMANDAPRYEDATQEQLDGLSAWYAGNDGLMPDGGDAWEYE